MTRDEIMALEGNALDAAVAVHVMGAVEGPRIGLDRAETWQMPDGALWWKRGVYHAWSPSTDLNHAHEAEKKIPASVEFEWLGILVELCGDTARMVHAPAPARCRAVLMAVMGASE